MLGACNTCVSLQSRDTSSGATVDGLSLFVCLCICFLFVCLFVFVTLFAFILLFILFYFFSLEFCGRGDGGGSIN